MYYSNRLSIGLKPNLMIWNSLMGDILSELPHDIRECIEYIMDDVIVYTADVKLHKRVLKCFLNKLRDYGLLLTINKVYIFRSNVKYMELMLSSLNERPTITPLGSRMKAISSLPILIIVIGVKSFIGCVIYLSQFLPKLSELIKPINDILKKSNRLHKIDKINPLKAYSKGKGIGPGRSPNIQEFWTKEHTEIFEAIKQLIVKASVLHLPNRNGTCKDSYFKLPGYHHPPEHKDRTWAAHL